MFYSLSEFIAEEFLQKKCLLSSLPVENFGNLKKNEIEKIEKI
jgi:predicted CopG family antitoxin